MHLELPNKIDENLSEILGIIVGDGYVRTRRPSWLSIEVSSQEKQYIDDYVIPLISKVFSCEPRGRFFNRNGVQNTYGFYICNKKLTEFLRSFGVAVSHNEIRVPEAIINNKKLYSSFLRGYFDTDGCLTFEKKHRDNHYYPRLIISSVSSMLIKDVEYMTDFFNIKGTIHTCFHGKKIVSPIHRYFIRGPNSLEMWNKAIGFSNSVHYTKYLIWKKLGHCETNTKLCERVKILKACY